MASLPDSSKLVAHARSRILAEIQPDNLLSKLHLVGKLLFVAYNGVAAQPVLRGQVSTLQVNYMRLCGKSQQARVPGRYEAPEASERKSRRAERDSMVSVPLPGHRSKGRKDLNTSGRRESAKRQLQISPRKPAINCVPPICTRLILKGSYKWDQEAAHAISSQTVTTTGNTGRTSRSTRMISKRVSRRR